MLLEKIKQHAGKFAFFVINALLVAVGVLYLKQKNLEDAVTKAISDNLANANNDLASGQQLQQAISQDQTQKTQSISGNTGTITKQETVPVTKTIPAVTKTVTTTQPVSSTSSSSSSSSKTTTKKS